MGALTDWLRRRAADAMQTDIVIGRDSEPLLVVIARLRALDAAAAVIVDAAGAVLGLLDAEAVLRKVVFALEPNQPARTALGRAALCRADEPLTAVVARMRRERLPALAVVDAAGRPAGVLRLEAALAVPLSGLLEPLGQLAAGDDVPGLAAAKRAQPRLAAALLAEHQPVLDVLGFTNRLNAETMARLTGAALGAMAADGWGEPPVPFTVLIMGSGGRGESLLHPDQDNGFILGDYPDGDHTLIDRYFLELAERLTRDLDAVGFPLCTGNVMATNPLWRKTLPQWKAQISIWARSRSGAATLFADIFFDFRPVYGPPELAAELRRHVTETVRGNLPFLNQMTWRQANQAAPVGWFGRLKADGNPERPDAIDLKLKGTMPLVELIRLLALRHGVEEIGTPARLAALRTAGVLTGEDHEMLLEAFQFLMDLLLRQQIAAVESGGRVGTHLVPDTLPRRDRERLKEAFRTIELLRKRVLSDFGGVGT